LIDYIDILILFSMLNVSFFEFEIL